MDYIKPFNHLQDAKGKRIKIILKNDFIYEGILESFDMHLNIVLSNVKEIKNNEESDKILIRGDMIVSINDL